MNAPVIILGAARSGTRMLRSLIASAGSHAEVPYDVNYIWRFGNESHNDDCLTEAMSSDRIQRFIQRQLAKSAGAKPAQPIVEKTVGNVLRIPFVQKTYPDAKYIFLYRDGRDVIESAYRCWQQPPSAGYLKQKLKSFPWFACQRYAWRYFKQVAFKSLGLSKQLNSWGPRYRGIDDDVRRLELLDVCCHQWVACMDAYERDRSHLFDKMCLEVRYEDLVFDGDRQAQRLAKFLDIDAGPIVEYCRTKINRSSVGKHSRLNSTEQGTIERIAGTTLERWGYRNQHSVAA